MEHERHGKCIFAKKLFVNRRIKRCKHKDIFIGILVLVDVYSLVYCPNGRLCIQWVAANKYTYFRKILIALNARRHSEFFLDIFQFIVSFNTRTTIFVSFHFQYTGYHNFLDKLNSNPTDYKPSCNTNCYSKVSRNDQESSRKFNEIDGWKIVKEMKTDIASYFHFNIELILFEIRRQSLWKYFLTFILILYVYFRIWERDDCWISVRYILLMRKHSWNSHRIRYYKILM